MARLHSTKRFGVVRGGDPNATSSRGCPGRRWEGTNAHPDCYRGRKLHVGHHATRVRCRCSRGLVGSDPYLDYVDANGRGLVDIAGRCSFYDIADTIRSTRRMGYREGFSNYPDYVRDQIRTWMCIHRFRSLGLPMDIVSLIAEELTSLIYRYRVTSR